MSQTEVYEIKYLHVGQHVDWEDRKATTMVVRDESEVVIYWAYIMWEDKSINEVRYNRQHSLQGNYITRDMADRIAHEQRELFTSMDEDRIAMLCMALTDAIETNVLGYWTTRVRYGYQENQTNGKMTDAWARITVWSEDENDGRKFFLTPFTIEKGIRTIVDNKNFQIRKDFWKDIAYADKHPADADLDSDMIDCIIQAALFGQIVYG